MAWGVAGQYDGQRCLSEPPVTEREMWETERQLLRERERHGRRRDNPSESVVPTPISPRPDHSESNPASAATLNERNVTFVERERVRERERRHIKYNKNGIQVATVPS